MTRLQWMASMASDNMVLRGDFMIVRCKLGNNDFTYKEEYVKKNAPGLHLCVIIIYYSAIFTTNINFIIIILIFMTIITM